MKKYTIYVLSLFLLFIVISAVVFTPNQAHATVGGPTFIYGFTYNPIDESVYYTSIDLGGRGCPPELRKLSLNSGKIDTVYSCDDGEKMIQKNGTYDESLVMVEIKKIVDSFKPLIPINLKDNKISIDINFINSEKSLYNTDGIAKINLTAIIYQNTKKIIEFPITGCNTEQPFTFEGYAIPGFDKKIILLLSTKSDCFEGGYITETVYGVGGVNNLNKVFRTNTIKDASALTPHEGTLIVFESEKNNVVTEASSNPKGEENNNEQGNNLIIQKEENESPLVIILIAFVAFIFLGIFLGKFLYTKK